MDGRRLHHFDALRAFAMALILPVHALGLMAMQGHWNDLEASTYWVLHAFRMPLFFLVAGFFAALMLESRGLRRFLRIRAVRIGLPLAVGVVFVVPVLTACIRAASIAPFRPGSSTVLGTLTDLYPSYLWFLWYLVLLYAIVLVARPAAGWFEGAFAAAKVAMSWLLTSRAGPLLLAAPTAALLYRQPTWMAGPSPANSFKPAFDLLAYYGLFFLSGWALFAIPGLRAQIEARPRRYVLYATLALPPALALYLLQAEPAVGQGRWFHLLALLLLSVSTWSIVFALLGLSKRHLSTYNPRLRNWADASYWIYLSHFVPLAALAALIGGIAMPGMLRFTVLIAATLALVYPAYNAFVRHSLIGRVLHGPKPRRKAPSLGQKRQQGTELDLGLGQLG